MGSRERLSFAAGLLMWLRLFLGPWYAWQAVGVVGRQANLHGHGESRSAPDLTARGSKEDGLVPSHVARRPRGTLEVRRQG